MRTLPSAARGEAGDGAQHGGLAGAALADEAEGAAPLDPEADVADGLDHAPAGAEADGQALDLDHGTGSVSQAGSRRMEARRSPWPLQPGQAAEQAAGVGVLRLVEGTGGQALQDAAGIHDQDAVAERGHQLEIVADEDEAHAAGADEIVEDRQHLHLHGDVEGGGGLVGDEEHRAGGQHDRDHRPLAHAARELVRVGGVDAFGIADAHLLQHLQGTPAGGTAADALVRAHGLLDLRGRPA